MTTTVKTKLGEIEGVLSEDGKTAIFKGIPYAKPPVGELRFKRPEPVSPWSGKLDATEFGARCPQADMAGMPLYGKEFYDVKLPKESEDCLYLNIWTPEKNEGGLPVLFWIHGGAFMNGFGSEKEFDGEGFAKKGVILVTINYRLNAFGFFAHPDLERENPEGVSGNYGCLDQICALKWVKENIEAFGGDGDKITIAGQSAGCMSVQGLISSPLAKGLFRGAILQSGGGIRSFAGTPDKSAIWEVSKKLLEILNVSTLEELREVPAEKLRDAAFAVPTSGGLGFTPHLDGWFLKKTTDDAALDGDICDVNYMIGSTSGDIGGSELLQGAGKRFCENQLKLGRRPAYLYYFDRNLPGDDAGAFHSSELWYEFETLPRCWRPFEECDYELSAKISGYWANFVRTGDPNGEGLPAFPAYTDSEKKRLCLGKTVKRENF